MTPERLASIATAGAAFDTETHLIQPGILAPPLVCASVAAWDPEGDRAHGLGAVRGALLDKPEAWHAFEALLADEGTVIVGANIAFDMLVMAVEGAWCGVDFLPRIFAAYDAGRVFDVQIAEMLHAVAGGHLGTDPRTGGHLRDPETGKPGRYSLATVADLVLGRTNAKANDEWRLRYAELENTPIAERPATARIYPVDDAVNTLEVAIEQVRTRRNLHDLAAQCYTAFALHCAAAWGMRTDPAAVAALEASATAARAAGLPRFIAEGWIRDDGSEDTARVRVAVALAYGASPGAFCPACAGAGKVASAKTGKPVNCATCSATGLELTDCAVPRTDPTDKFPLGQVQIGRDVLAESGDDRLMDLGSYKEDDKILDTYLPFLRSGVDAPINLRPNVILETGRVSYSGVVQLLPREGGVRECVIPRAGFVFYSVDYDSGELVTHAQSCLALVGHSKLAEALNAGVKPHNAFAATMVGVSYEEFNKRLEKEPKFKAYRQAAKPANFGFPGGMGAVRLVLQQRKQGPDTPCDSGPATLADGARGYKGLRFCVLIGGSSACGELKVTEWKNKPCPPTCRRCIECAERLRDTWFRQWPENKPYFDHVSRLVDQTGSMVQHYSGRVRGGVTFTSAANGYFQGLLADVAKRAQCRVSREQYTVPSSPLYGSRSILFAHDELFGEAPESTAAEAAERVSEIMVEEFRTACPDLARACKAEPTLMRRWYKSAKCTRDSAGRLIPWEP